MSFRKFFAYIISFITVFYIAGSFFLFSVFTFFLDTENYDGKLTEVIFETINENLSMEIESLDLPGIEEVDVAVIISKSFSIADVDFYVKEVLTELKNKDIDNGYLEINVSSERLNKVYDEVLGDFSEEIFGLLPECESNFEFDGLNCRPDFLKVNDFKDELRAYLVKSEVSFSNVSEDLSFEIEVPQDLDGSVFDYLNQRFISTLVMALVGVGILLILLFFINGRPWLLSFQRLVSVLLISSVFVLSIGFFGLKDLNEESVRQILSGFNYSSENLAAYLEFFNFSVVSIASSLKSYGLFFFAISLVVYLLLFVSNRKQKNDAS